MYNKENAFLFRGGGAMSTKESLELEEITSENPLLSSIRSIVETAFYGNNVQEVFDRKTAYQLAKGSP